MADRERSTKVLNTPNSTTMVGIIGGSGLDDPDLLADREEVEVDTPYGKPSDKLIKGKIDGVPCVLLARHGRKHTVMPTNVNYRANLFALKELGCTHVVVSTACGSLREENQPGDIIVIDQFIDRTTKRASTFYDGDEGHPIGVSHTVQVVDHLSLTFLCHNTTLARASSHAVSPRASFFITPISLCVCGCVLPNLPLVRGPTTCRHRGGPTSPKHFTGYNLE